LQNRQAGRARDRPRRPHRRARRGGPNPSERFQGRRRFYFPAGQRGGGHGYGRSARRPEPLSAGAWARCMFRVPLAWLLLKNEPARLLIGIAGVMFAVVLMLMQMGFQTSLYSSATMFHSHLAADLVLVNPQYEFLAHMKPFARARLYESLGVAGVESA